MIIVSQDKKWSFNFSNTTSIGIDEENTIKIITTAGKWNILGNYKTEERAKEVLKEIITANSNFSYLKNATEEGKNYIINLLKHKYEQFAIFQIPKE